MKEKTLIAELAMFRLEMDLYERHLKHSGKVLDALQRSDYDALLVSALSLEASIAALRHWIMHNRMGIDLDKTSLH